MGGAKGRGTNRRRERERRDEHNQEKQRGKFEDIDGSYDRRRRSIREFYMKCAKRMAPLLLLNHPLGDNWEDLKLFI